MKPEQWTDVNEPVHAGEESALNFLKRNLPETEPYRAWGPSQFDANGNFPEVDSIVVAPKGIFLIEIKSWLGDVVGDAREWVQVRPNGVKRKHRNPFIGTDHKAKKLKSALEERSAFKKSGKHVPWVNALVFMSGHDFRCRLPEDARVVRVGRTETFRPSIAGYGKSSMPRGAEQGGGLPGIVESITRAPLSNCVNTELSAIIAQGLTEILVPPDAYYSRVNSAVLGDLIAQDEETIEYSAHHETDPDKKLIVVFHRRVNQDERPGAVVAENAADRQYTLLGHPETQHVGLPDAVDLDLDHHWGPAVVLAVGSGALPLNEFLAQQGDTLGDAERIDLVRRLGDALSYVHDQNTFHRTLSPRSVQVFKSDFGHWQPVITGWQKGLRAADETGGPEAVGGGGKTIIATAAADEIAFQAPEASAPAASPRALDVFSLGALAYLIITGKAPPSNLGDESCLDPRPALGDGADDYVCEMIRNSTQADPDDRMQSVEEIVEYANLLAERSIELPAGEEPVPENPPKRPGGDAPAAPLDPSLIQRGFEIGSFTITHRLAEGSTAVAAIAERRSDGRKGVLKVASSEEKDRFVRAEGLALSNLRSRTIVELLDGPIELAGRQAIFLNHADKGTLRSYLDEEDTIGPGDAFQFGLDLVAALVDLEAASVVHRDIKPENIGIMRIAEGDQAVLMDFSLADASLEDIGLGTPPYLDPFLGQRAEVVYDAAADRYSAAVVMHEMLTGKPPRWGDGSKAAYLSELRLCDEAFPEELSEALNSFFNRAMSSELPSRFGSASEMRRAWEDAFTEPAAPEPDIDPPVTADNRPAPFPLAWSPPPPPRTAKEMVLVINESWEDQAATARRRAAARALAEEPRGETEHIPAPGSAPIVIDTVGRRIRISFRKPRGQVTAAETEALAERLSEVPKSQIFFSEGLKRWQLEPTPETAMLIQELAQERDCGIRTRARNLLNHLLASSPKADGQLLDDSAAAETSGSGEPEESRAFVKLGKFLLYRDAIEELFDDVQPPGSDTASAGKRFIHEVDGPDGIRLLVADEHFSEGGRQVRLLDACNSGARFERLGLRMGVRPVGADLEMMLDQARMTSEVRSTKRKATEEELSEGADTDVAVALKSLGAAKIGLRREILGDGAGAHKNKLSVVFPTDAVLVPVASYVLTRVAPVYNELSA